MAEDDMNLLEALASADDLLGRMADEDLDRTYRGAYLPDTMTAMMMQQHHGVKALTDRNLKNSMDNWFPRVKEAGVNHPETTRVEVMQSDDGAVFPDPDAYTEALSEYDPPVFIRTDQRSAKHAMDSLSRVPADCTMKEATRRAMKIIEKTFTADVIGLPVRAVYVREWLDLDERFRAFDDMPVAPEVRYFLHDGTIHDRALYWPEDALADHTDHDAVGKSLDAMRRCFEAEEDRVLKQINPLCETFEEGYWSVDVARGMDGTWWVIDAAVGECSYHPESIDPPADAGPIVDRINPERLDELFDKPDADNAEPDSTGLSQ